MLKNYCNSLINNWKENLYLLSLAAFLIALPTSIALISITSVSLLIVWALTGDYKAKRNRLIHNKSALLLMSIPLLYLIGLCFTHHFSIGIQEFNKSIYWFLFAFVLSSSPPVSKKITYRLLGIYILVVSIAAGVALCKLFFLDAIHFFDFRKVTWIDHIPFSYQIAFAAWLIFYFIYQEKFSALNKILLIFLIIFLTVSLFALKSFTGYLYFGVMSFTALLWLIWQTTSKILKYTYLGLAIFLLVFPVCYVYSCVKNFYATTEYTANEIVTYTAKGNLYRHNFEDKTKENGNYVRLFMCEEELKPLWDAHCNKQYESITSDGYPLKSVIIRYMTSKGLPKDAEGFAQLTQQDINNIENEITNYIFAENKLSVYPRVYAVIWEMDQYRIGQNPNQKTLAQRIDLAMLAFRMVKNHFWVGIGLGNNAKAYEEVIIQSDAKLSFPETGSSHNQYLNYMIRFGILGTLYILGVLTYVFLKGRKNNPFLLTLFFVSMLFANFGDANWETFVGLNYFVFFFGFFMWLTPKNLTSNTEA
jgi:hypothetical protein